MPTEKLPPEERARMVVDAVARTAEPIPIQYGGGHRLDLQRVYEEALAAINAAIKDSAAGKTSTQSRQPSPSAWVAFSKRRWSESHVIYACRDTRYLHFHSNPRGPATFALLTRYPR